jgi:hypothetical protein
MLTARLARATDLPSLLELFAVSEVSSAIQPLPWYVGPARKAPEPGVATLNFILNFEPNGTAHDDVTLVFAGISYRCDSYYFAIDQGLLPGRDDAVKARAVVRRLLEQWRQAVASLEPDGFAYLPYDFSDECTAWLRCHRVSETKGVEMVRGWSSVQGWSIVPSELGDAMKSVAGFHADTPPLSTQMDDVLDAIDDSLLRLGRDGDRD